ncbi:hypothetical protein K502DRAFT_352924 [Neoconidiobolus thromboides FSU 785]|nr:hypothetical protein K502DRAFT_352924 [Neoconidiobolus thromboides FSU 785]
MKFIYLTTSIVTILAAPSAFEFNSESVSTFNLNVDIKSDSNPSNEPDLIPSDLINTAGTKKIPKSYNKQLMKQLI